MSSLPNNDFFLPEDGAAGALLGRAWLPGEIPGPALVRLNGETVEDITAAGPTAAELLTPIPQIDHRFGDILG